MMATNMMQASPYPAQPGMGPGHPGMAHGHPMQVQHGAHMGQPNPAMVGGMHPGMSGPQVTQGGPMASGMPPNPGTPAPGNPMQNAMALAHLGGQNPMFHGQNPQMNMGQMQANANMIARQRAMNSMMQAQAGGQIPHNMMANMGNIQHLNPAQLQQMKALNMPLQQMQQMQHMTPQQQQMIHQQQQYQHQQRMMAQHAHAQQQIAAQQRQAAQQQQHQQQQQAQQQQAQHQQAQQQQQQQQQQAQQQQQQQQQHASQQMQMSRSQEQTSQAPQPHPTPAPQVQAPPQPQAPPTTQPQQQTPKPQPPQPQPPTSQAQQPQPQQQQQQQQQQTNPPTPQIKQSEPEDEAQMKNDMTKQQILMDDLNMNRAQTQDFSGQCILQLLSYYDNLAYPARPNDIEHWQEFVARYYSASGSVRQQLYSNKTQTEKSFQITFPSLARFYHAHFKNGIKRMFMQSFEHTQEDLQNGGFSVFSKKLYVTYEYNNGLKVIAQGHLSVQFDDMQKIEHLRIGLTGWTEYLPRTVVGEYAVALEQNRQSPKMTKKNLPKNQQQQQQQQRIPTLPQSPVSEWGIPQQMLQFLEVAEVINIMGSLVQYHHQNPSIAPREALNRFNAENSQAQRAMAAQMYNNNSVAINGQGPIPNQRMAGMNPPNQFQSPAFSHLGLPQNQGSPRVNHTPSPAHNAQGGVQMVHQMSAQGSSNMSGSQGPSTNTSPNVTNKRRRASQIKEEDNQILGGDSRTKPSPRVNKRQKGQPA